MTPAFHNRLVRLLLPAAICLLASAASLADDAIPISPAENLMFQTNHMAAVHKATVLRYSFARSGSMEQAFNDQIELDVKPGPKPESHAVSTSFLTGTRKVEYPSVDASSGNPVLLYFLERDIREMERLTGGKANYFRKSIRIAFSDAAQIKPVTITLAGKATPAREVTITPYVNDPLKDRIGKYVGKTYSFTFADQVPGQVYQIRTRIPDPANAAGTPLLEEVATFDGTGKRGTESAKRSEAAAQTLANGRQE